MHRQLVSMLFFVCTRVPINVAQSDAFALALQCIGLTVKTHNVSRAWVSKRPYDLNFHEGSMCFPRGWLSGRALVRPWRWFCSPDPWLPRVGWAEKDSGLRAR